MSLQTPDRWQDLFGAPAGAADTAQGRLRVVRRGGRELLYLPTQAALAAKALALYPAQSPKARAAKRILGLTLRLGVSPLRERVRYDLAAAGPFARFLAECAGSPTLPRFAVLAGNPNALGRRFVFLVFNPRGEPTAVVKAGASEAAQQLLANEEDMLASLPAGTPGVPRLLGSFRIRGTRAIALKFFAGQSPKPDDSKPLAALLTAWLERGHHTSLRQLGPWRQLSATSANKPLPTGLAAAEDLPIHSTLAHGDLAPWNIKVTPERWMVLDWERGEHNGVPGWDWLHFVIQHAVLVRNESATAILGRLEKLFMSPDFSTYAQCAGFLGKERLLALAYLAHATRITQQTEGLETMKQLEQAAAARWFPAAP